MSRNRDSLIEELVDDLRPVEHPGKTVASVAAWLALSIVYSIVIVFATGPLRPGALGNLLAYPAFGGETLLALVAIVSVAYAAVRSAIPGEWQRRPGLIWALVPVAAWVAVYVVGLWYPAHPVSELGKRDLCIWQAVAYSLPSLGLMLWIARRLYPLRPRATAALGGVAAAAIPGALMQFGCMYVPQHILTHHLTPMLVTAAIGAVLGPLVISPRAAAARRRNAFR